MFHKKFKKNQIEKTKEIFLTQLVETTNERKGGDGVTGWPTQLPNESAYRRCVRNECPNYFRGPFKYIHLQKKSVF
jgi:hypothetical protein